jgi:hypothetical protein
VWGTGWDIPTPGALVQPEQERNTPA